MTDTATQTGQVVPFDHINLNEVDPQAQAPANGVPFTFLITEAGVKDVKTEKYDGKAIDLKFTITGSEQYTGRSFYSRLFPDKEGGKNATKRRLRILMDSTGIPQDGTMDEFLASLVANRAIFNAPLEQRDGVGKQEVNLWKVSPAG